MEGELFAKTHASLTALLILQKENRDIGTGLSVLRKLLEEGAEDAEPVELSAVQAAAVVGIRVLADGSLRSGVYSSTVEHYASIIGHIFKRDNLEIFLKWAEHVRPLLAILLSDLSGSNYCVQCILWAIKGLTEFVLRSDDLRPELLSSASTPLVGKLVSVCLDTISSDSRSVEARDYAVNILSRLSSTPPARTSLSVVLPGLTSRLSSFLVSNSSSKMTVSLIQLFFQTIVLCLQDGKLDDAQAILTGKLTVSRTSDWAHQTAGKLVPLISKSLARLSQNRDETVRLVLLNCSQQVSSECREAFGKQLEPTFTDLFLLLLADEHPSIVTRASDLFEAARTDEITVYMMEQLSKISKRLATYVRQKSDSSFTLKQITSILTALGPSLRSITVTHSPVIVSLVRALASTIRINAKRLAICFDDADSITDIITTLPMNFGLDIRSLLKICKVWGENCGLEIIDLLSFESRDCSQGERTAFLVLQFFVLESLSSNVDSFSLQSMAELFCDEMQRIELEPVLNDFEDVSREADEGTALTIMFIACLTASTKRLPEGRNRILLISIYRMLQFSSSSNWILSSTADMALKELAKSSGASLSSFLAAHNIYILSSVELACRSFERHSTAPLALEAFLNKVDDPVAFEAVKALVDTLLVSLDSHKQTWNYVILRSLKSFAMAMNRWFSEIQRIEPEEEEKELIPSEIRTVEKILLRTKHLLSAESFPVRLLTMDILIQGIQFLRNFDNQLLPMVHQNWMALVNRLNDDNLESRKTAFLVIVEMTKVTKSFVYRKVIYEAWPLIAKWLERNIQKNTALPQSSSFRYAETILTRSTELFISIEIREDDWIKIRPVFEVFQAEWVHSSLKSSSTTTLNQIDDYFQSL